MQSRGRHGKRRAIGELKAAFGAHSRDARISETSIGEREQAGDFSF